MVSLLLLLALGAPSREVLAAHAELDEVAARIEQLKERHEEGGDVGRELHRLLVRAQELSYVIERASASAGGAAPRPLVVVPSPEELRERADAGRDEADRLAAVIDGLDARIAAHRRAEGDTPPRGARAGNGEATLASATASGTGAPRAAVGPTPATPATSARLRALIAHRAMLAERLVAVQREVERLEAEATRLEAAP